MRILSVHFNSSVNGGAEIVCIHGNRLLAERGHRIAWLTIGVPQEALTRGEAAFYLPEAAKGSKSLSNIIRHFYNPASIRLAKQAIHEFRPDVVHVHTIFGYRYLSPAVLLPFRECSIPVIQTLHDYGLICPASFLFSSSQVCEACHRGKYFFCALKRCRESSFLKSCAAALNAYLKDYAYQYDRLIAGYIAPSHFLRHKFIQFGYAPEKIDVVPNAYFQANPFSKVPPVPKQRDYIFFAGRLSHEKGVDILIKAAKGLDVKVKIAGDGPERETLQALKQQLDAGNVEFLGHRPHSSLGALYRNAAWTIFPSRWYENGPLILLESFAHATPVIASEIGAIPEFVKHGQTGYLFRVGDVAHLRQTLQSALADRANLERMGENAYRFQREAHSQEIYSLALENVLKKHMAGVR